MMLGLLVAFWATPDLTTGHFFFAAAGTSYILLGLRFEERDLRQQLGQVYLDYADRVPALVPALSRGVPATRGGTDRERGHEQQAAEPGTEARGRG